MVIAWAIARIVPDRGDRRNEAEDTSERPVEILDRRLASGEIDEQTYDRLRSKLTLRPAAGTG